MAEDQETTISPEKDWLQEARKFASKGRPDLVLESLTIASWSGEQLPVEDRLGLLSEARHNRGMALNNLFANIQDETSRTSRAIAALIKEDSTLDFIQAESLQQQSEAVKK